MRDLILFAFIAAFIPLSVAVPYVGALLWAWISFMNPHRESWGLAANFPFVMAAAVATLIGWWFSQEKKAVFGERTVLIMFVFLAWTGVTTLTAFDPTWSSSVLIETTKTFVLAVVVIGLINNKSRIQALLWVIAISIGYYSVKGASSFILTGGRAHVVGPEQSMIADNNNLGLAQVMILPIMNYLRVSSRGRLATLLATGLMAATAIAIVGTYSRGALFGLAIVASLLWFRSRQKISIALGILALFIALQSTIPPQWLERMQTIRQYSTDQSFEGRMQAWRVALRVADDRPLVGGGYSATLLGRVFEKYRDPGSDQPGTAAHSIYFEVLGDHGYVGLALYLLMITVCWLNLVEIGKLARRRLDLRWAEDQARMLQVSIVGFLAGGALLSMAYYDAFIVLLAISASMRTLMKSVVIEEDGPSVSDWRKVGQSGAWKT